MTFKNIFPIFTNSILFKLYVGGRFINHKNGKNNIIFNTLFAGIAGGLAVLVVVIGVMNGFQNNYITRRVEVGSYHAVITHKKGISAYKKIVDDIYKNIPEIEAAVPHSDREVIILFKNRANSDKQPIKLRAIDTNELQKDSGFLKYCKIVRGDFNLDNDSILLGEELGWRQINYAKQGNLVYITPDVSIGSLKNEGLPFKVKGYFNTGSYDYDRYWVFIGLNAFHTLTGNKNVDSIGLKFKAKVNRKEVISRLKKSLPDDLVIRDASEINKGYFAALKLEKTMISFLFLIIFIMVCVNIYGALKLTILEKKESILILKAIGLQPSDIEIIFLLESILLAFGGTAVGLIIGVFVSLNILSIFAVIEYCINGLLYIALPAEVFNPVKLYDTSIYYQTDLLVKFYPHELATAVFALIIMTIVSALIPIFKASRIRPNEINRTVL
ncbi:MAG: hypothetical protein A2015_06480 [Spirochaetes bacterium GWF1_31_7]|nr:MAG: hypothetical protein A2Y30_08315 [Spirochaetes bacterium GWE1_32_154]OHD51391.1 MAG: hypothetical protein A2Y29_14700 [Spirochaetes bacterium GWE2_31_10]OHD53117.1 MAG: hypothetical protein A2015_06480 [Spirochaetes bacterium GWF1_31_7]OHD82260.1 MAG: hypothetical protein A2355_00980 [Spirochaetes bacterium RIFOXYB1_FULL_32_8]HBD94462.1 hypothetical protein [Spirochaetia bacterium]